MSSATPAPISVLSLNIWCGQTIDRVLFKIDQLQPDIVFLQEVFAADLARLTAVCGPLISFVPLANINQVNRWNLPPRGEWGLASFARLPVAQNQVWPIAGQLQPVPLYNSETGRTVALAGLRLDLAGWEDLWWLQTHFTWSPDGQATDQQRKDATVLRSILDKLSSYVLLGDLNAPIDGEILSEISRGLINHLPANCLTTVDQKWHRKPDLQLVVDALLSTPAIRLSEITLFDDVSDHWGIWARVLPPVA